MLLCFLSKKHVAFLKSRWFEKNRESTKSCVLDSVTDV